MKKIATAAIAVLLCLTFCTAMPTAPAKAQTTIDYGACRYYYTGEPTFDSTEIYQRFGIYTTPTPIEHSKLNLNLQTGVINPGNAQYFILDLGTPFSDVDGILANCLNSWRETGVRIMLITHHDERFIDDDIQIDDPRIDYMNYANVFLGLDIFYDFTTEILANTIIDAQQTADSDWLNSTTMGSAFNGTVILDKFFTEYVQPEEMVNYLYTYDEYWRYKYSQQYPLETHLWRHSLCETNDGGYMRRRYYDYDYNTPLVESSLWQNNSVKPNLFDSPYFFVRSVNPLNINMQAEVNKAEIEGVPYFDWTFTQTQGADGFLPIPEVYHQMKYDYLEAFLAMVDIPHEI